LSLVGATANYWRSSGFNLVLFFLLCDDVAVSGQPPEGGVALHVRASFS
jgi:hypothetical protein